MAKKPSQKNSKENKQTIQKQETRNSDKKAEPTVSEMVIEIGKKGVVRRTKTNIRW